jgi:uncharacterized protein YggE
MRLISATGLAFALAVANCTTSFAQIEDRDSRLIPHLSVIGHGKVAAIPDVADINIGVVTQGTTAKEALRHNSDAMAGLQKVLKEKGIDTKDIETTQIQVSPIYSHPDSKRQPGEEYVPRVVGYRVVNSVDVTVHEVGKLGDMLDVVIGAGANQVNGISFRVEKAQQLLDEARRRAMADAKRKAELLAVEAGVTLGPVRQIVEAGSSPMGTMHVGASTSQAMVARSAPTVAAGEQELSVSIQVSYAIMPPKS